MYPKRRSHSSLLLLFPMGVMSDPTCYNEDITILGGQNVIISNVLRCAGHVGGQSGTITECMQETYPGYGLVSDSCLQCTTDVMLSTQGANCLPQCIDQLSSSGCRSCSPTLADLWASTCDKGVPAPPGSSGSAEHSIVDPTCSQTDIRIVQSGSHFVMGSLNCLRDLSTFQSCLYGAVPGYNGISNSCKACAASVSTVVSGMGTIQAQDCGAICMQQSADSSSCSECGGGIARSFDILCLHQSGTPAVLTSLAILVMVGIATVL